MSWQDHTTALMKTGDVSGAVILDIVGGTTFAYAPDNFYLVERTVQYTKEDGTKAEKKVDEAKELIDFMKLSHEDKGTKGNVWLNGVNYLYLRSDEERGAAFFKCNNGGACAVQTKTTLILGVWANDTGKFKSAGNCNLQVFKLARDFEKSGV